MDTEARRVVRRLVVVLATSRDIAAALTVFDLDPAELAWLLHRLDWAEQEIMRLVNEMQVLVLNAALCRPSRALPLTAGGSPESAGDLVGR